MHWNVGAVKITKIVELETVGSTRFILPQASKEEVQKLPWLVPRFATEEGRLKMSIHTLVVETPSRRIVVDTGLGNGKEGRNVPTWNMRNTPFLEIMAKAGFPPDSIDTVLCTHLHVDHVGWNTRLLDGRWVPTFPKARYVFSDRELEFWTKREKDDAATCPWITDSVLPIVEAKKAEFVSGDHGMCGCLTLKPAPGHTPGNVVIHARSGDQSGVFMGDVIHHPLQLLKPEWSTLACTDRELSRTTRTRLIEEHAERGTRLLPAHFPAPTVGRIVRRGSAYWYAFE